MEKEIRKHNTSSLVDELQLQITSTSTPVGQEQESGTAEKHCLLCFVVFLAPFNLELPSLSRMIGWFDPCMNEKVYMCS